MKILYFGTICDINRYEQKLKNLKIRPTIATVVFEEALLKGFKECGADLKIYTFPMLPVFPKSKYFYWGAIEEHLSCGYDCTWLKTVNLPFLKQIVRKIHGRNILKEWIRMNKEENCIISTYSIPPFLAKDIIKYCAKYNVKCCAIIPDLLKNMYMYSKKSKLVKKIQNLYLKNALKVQGNYDGYVYLVEEMKNVVNPIKPYVVMEGIANIDKVIPPGLEEKNKIRAVMYAGGLHMEYGIMNLIKSFYKLQESIGKNLELWLFGEGNAIENIKMHANKNHSIRYFGVKSHDEILIYERRATLLVNVRNPNDEFTAYSFPSKTIEYMMSGTPLLTTRLRGIPDDYFEYVFSCSDNKVEQLADSLKKILLYSDEELLAIGRRAQEYILKNKNSVVQSKKIMNFFETLFEF